MTTLAGQGEFFDLARYVMEVAEGGASRAAELKPAPDQLVADDEKLDHAGIIRSFKKRDFNEGKKIYMGLCTNCHGANGNTPSLPTARAFGRQEMKFGSDPFRMFQTLTHGNGLMAPMLHLSAKERYQVVHFIRERFMKSSNPGYQAVTKKYLETLPGGKARGETKLAGERDFGPALASQFGREVTSALTVKLGAMAMAYDLHTMDPIGVWRGGFLRLDATQHMRGRGEGVPEPRGEMLTGLAGWQWGHDGSLDYSREDLLPRGPLPAEWMDYRGHYLDGDRLLLSYTIDGREVLELPQAGADARSLRRTLRIGPGKSLVLATARSSVSRPDFEGVLPFVGKRLVGKKGPATSNLAISARRDGEGLGSFTASAVSGDVRGMVWSVDDHHRLILQIPADARPRLVDIICFSGEDEFEELRGRATAEREISDLVSFTRGGRGRWPDVLTTVGYLGAEKGAYAVDTITIPESTPWNTWFRTSALDFFADGRMVVATHGGDIWIVSGIDDKLVELKWKRFAGGLYEPFGVKVVKGSIYVTCKDRLTRLHDLNGDGEADFYESFSADTDVSSFFHAFNFDLQTDARGNFYYAKSGQYTSYVLPGSVIKVSPDGSKREVYCTGFRTPNGMGILPDGRPTVSDNQGNWMPASKISLVKPGGFYGYVQTHSSGDRWAPDGGRIDHTKVIPPETFDQPIIWMPQEFDNSSGGQIWAGDPRWGPLSGRLLHTSFGKGWLYYLMLQDVGNISQAAIIKLPHDFVTGIMRGRVNPRDGQIYVAGLDGWNGGGRKGLRDKGIERVRYTGKAFRMVSDCQVEGDGLRLSFNFPVDPATASDPRSYAVEQWDYKWRKSYGSSPYHPVTGKTGKQKVEIASVMLSADKKNVKLKMDSIRPVNQLHMKL
ncbi:MAG: c-type cytochrome, partial [Planctomycetota bacterium]|nr:c-type cytochrome [Planctomycetota bacterium]